MADAENTKRRGRPPKRVDADRATGEGPVGTEARPDGANEVLGWERVSAAVLDAEVTEGPHGRRIVRVFTEDAQADMLLCVYGSAPVVHGAAGYQFSDGEVVTL